MTSDTHTLNSEPHVTQPAAQAAGAQSVGQGAPGFAEALQVTGGLLFVVLLIIGACLLLRRFSNVGRSTSGRALRVVDSHSLGGKERVTVVEVDNTWLVLGVSPQGVNTLHQLDKPAVSSVAQPPAASSGMPFAQALKEAARQSFKRTARSPDTQ